MSFILSHDTIRIPDLGMMITQSYKLQRMRVRGYVDEIGLEDIDTYCKDLETLGHFLMRKNRMYLDRARPCRYLRGLHAPLSSILLPQNEKCGLSYYCKGLRQLSLSVLPTDHVFYFIRAYTKNREMLFVYLGLHSVLSLEIRDCSFGAKAVGQCCKAGDKRVAPLSPLTLKPLCLPSGVATSAC
ncbi:hypothetical protein P3S67_032454 [Capsicum chacoense]